MSQKKEEEALLPPWAASVAKMLVPLGVVVGIWVLLSKLNLPAAVVIPSVLGLLLAVTIYFGGRYYKPFRIDRATARCIAKTVTDRKTCRHYMPGAKLGGGCGRLREDRGCRYVKR